MHGPGGVTVTSGNLRLSGLPSVPHCCLSAVSGCLRADFPFSLRRHICLKNAFYFPSPASGGNGADCFSAGQSDPGTGRFAQKLSRHHPVGGGGFFNQLKGYIEDGIVLFGLVVAAAAFVKVAEAAVTTFLRCVTARRAGDSSGPLSWSGVVLLVAVIWLLGKSANIIL